LPNGLYFMKFFGDEWERDMAHHPPEIQAWWLLVCWRLHRQHERGKMSMTVGQWAGIIRASEADTQGFLDYLQREEIADVTLGNGRVTVVSRRMLREEKAKESTRKRVAKHRRNTRGNGAVTDRGKEVRGKEVKNTPQKPPKGGKRLRVLSKTQAALFEAFWAEYPKKKSKGDAEKAWKTINPSKPLVETMLSTIRQAKTSEQWTKDNRQYIPYPATWLRAKGWEDEIETTADMFEPNPNRPMA